MIITPPKKRCTMKKKIQVQCIHIFGWLDIRLLNKSVSVWFFFVFVAKGKASDGFFFNSTLCLCIGPYTYIMDSDISAKCPLLSHCLRTVGSVLISHYFEICVHSLENAEEK